MAKLTNNDNETIEIATDEDVYMPIASTSTLGVASFNSDDFTVAQNGKVSLINKVAGIQFLGTITAASDSMLTWKISEYSDGDIEAPVAGDKIMLLESIAFNYDENTSSYIVNEDSATTGDLVFTAGGIYVLTSVQAYDTSTLEPVYTNTEYISLLKGGADGVDGADANVKVGTVTTNTVYSTTANVSVTGTTSNHTTTLDFTFDVPNVGEKGEDGADGTNGKDGSDGKDGTDGADGAPAYVGKVGVLECDVESVNFTDVTWINYTPTTDLECVIYLSEYSDSTEETIVTELCVGKVLYESGLVTISDKVVISGADAADIDTSLFVTQTQFLEAFNGIPDTITDLIDSNITERIDQGTLIGESEYKKLFTNSSVLDLVDVNSTTNEVGTAVIKINDIELTNSADLLLDYYASNNQVIYSLSVNGIEQAIPLSISTSKTDYQVQLTVGSGTDAVIMSADVPKVSFATSSTGGGIKISDSFSVDTTLYPVVNSTGGITFATSYVEDQNLLSKATSIFDNYALSSTVTTNYNTLNNKFSSYVAVDNLASYFGISGTTLYINGTGVASVTVDMSDYVDNDTFNTTISKYLLIDTASSTYATQTTVTANYNTLNSKFDNYLLASALEDYSKTDDLASIIMSYGYATLADVANVGYLTAIPTLYASVDSNGAITISTTAGTGTNYNYISNYVSPFDISAYKIIVDSNNALVLSNSSTATAVTTSSLASLLDSNFMTATEVTSAIEAYNYVTSSDVTSAITSYGYTTLTEVAKQGYLTNSIFGTYDSLAEYLSGNNYVTEAVQSVSEGTTNGTVIVKTSSGTSTTVAVAGLGSAAYTDASAYATAAQGSLAATAVQSVSTGTSNGTILVDGSSVSVQGLGSAAYTASTAYAAASVADTVSSLSSTVSTLSSKVSTLESAGTTYTISENGMSNGIQLVLKGSDGSSSSINLYPVVTTDGTLSLSASNSSSYSLSNYISYSDSKLTIAGDEVSISGGTASIDTFTANIDSTGNITLAVNGVNAYVDISSYVEGIATGDQADVSYLYSFGEVTNEYEVGAASWFIDVSGEESSQYVVNNGVFTGAVEASQGKVAGINIATADNSIVQNVSSTASSLQASGGTSDTLGVDTAYQIQSDGSIFTNNIQFADYGTDTLVNADTAIICNAGTAQLVGSWATATSLSVTSDRNFKQQIEYSLPDAYEELFDALKPTRYLYTYGSSSRYHTGFIAQDVESAVKNAGLSSTDFAGYTIDNSGRYGLRYDEFIALCVNKIQKLEKRISALEQQNNQNQIK